jgi:integrase/recombinase XerD
MDANGISCNLTKYVKVGADRWQYCPVVRGKTGRIKQDAVIVNGRIETHPEGYYSVDWRESGKRHRSSLGKNAAEAQHAYERRVACHRARAMGIAVSEEPASEGITVAEACEQFLIEIRLQRSPKTFKQYRTALAYFKEVSGEQRLDQVDRRTLLAFRHFLAQEKKLSPRTICTKMMIAVQMLKSCGRTGILGRGDWPRYVERVPQAYSPEQLQRFFAACKEKDRLLFQFFLGSGFREKEVQFLTWRDLSLGEHVARVTAKPECGFFPKTWEERAVLIPTDLVNRLRMLQMKADPDCRWVFPTSTGCVDRHFLERCKSIAWKAGLNCRLCRGKYDCRTGPYCRTWFLHKFRATYATNQLRAGTDIRTLQVWLGHKDLASTMRYLQAGHGSEQQERVDAAFAVITESGQEHRHGPEAEGDADIRRHQLLAMQPSARGQHAHLLLKPCDNRLGIKA